MSKPTPRPWTPMGAAVTKIDAHHGSVGTLAKCYKDGGFQKPLPKGTAEANAAHIVKCVNMHDELVSLLRHLCSEITVVERNAILFEAREVIAKAEAGE